jgi:succinyl-diaminopimelate desuccinylase
MGRLYTAFEMSPLAERALSLIRIPSVIGEERALADAVAAWAAAHYPPAEVLRVSHSFVLGRRVDPRPMLLLVGHLDTVPANPASGPARLEGDRLYGLGASDMKGAVAVMQALAEAVRREELPVNLVLVLYEREEGPFLQSGLGPLFEAAPEVKGAALAVALEPTDGAVQVGCVGSLHASLTFRGQAAHSARPWQGKNAIHAAGAFLVELDARGRRPVLAGGHTFFEVMSVTLARGGRARNVVPDALELNLNYRFAPGKSLAEAQADVLGLVAGRCEVAFTDLAPSGAVVTGNPHLDRLVALTGRPAEAKQAWTDVARFAELGVPAVNYGPGETAQAHQPEESASVSALERSLEVLLALVRGG